MTTPIPAADAVTILPCPFCEAEAKVYGAVSAFAVNCTGCNAYGPSVESKADAIAAWNRRAAIQASGEPVHQSRTKGSELWMDCTGKDAEVLKTNPVFEVRTLYTAPAPQAIQAAGEQNLLQVGVAATGKGATIVIMQRHQDGAATVIYSGEHPIGDSAGRAMIVSAPAPQADTSGAAGEREWPTNDELVDIWNEQHHGHPADFAADVLERWGGCPAGLLGNGGALSKRPTAAPSPVQAQPVASDELRDVAQRFPELNMSNYADVDVDRLNDWGIEICEAIDNLATQPTAPVSPAKTPPLNTYALGQWWLVELEKHWGNGESSSDTRRAAKVACNFAQTVLGTPVSPAGVGASGLALNFKLVKDEFPALTDHSDSYGGTWTSKWCVCVHQDGKASCERFSVTESEKDALDRGNRKHVRWLQGNSRYWGQEYLAWAYIDDVRQAIDAALKSTKE